MKQRHMALLAFALPFAAQADESGFRSIGIGLSASQGVYAGEDRSVSLLPLVHYESERFFVRGLTGGVHLYESDGFGLDAIVAGRFDGIDADDFGREELLENGIDRDLLEDRDDGLDLGLRGTWRGAAGELQATARGDVSGASDGYELSLEYGYPFSVAGAEVTPSLKMSYLSNKLADYYYGTLSKEEARSVARYRPGGAFIPGVALGISKPLGERWLLNAEASYQRLPSDISDSPLTEGDSGVFGIKVGLSWSFD
ncbi:MipA/OmpV family protein [Ectopseudomonas toyotomiensis]|uniref:MipA/OmpV family protein n=1 Tax=Ectopseudomonas toyotomiensis TaxID=554344 RepID=A0ABD7DW87_9GAMM|nr:MipA/OmpV family protein [Pseudomonas toyotomiensis]QSL92754.1 MipA/OmpV family protein [Pseudomonas toyotomiensis]